jgi:hypothetical protein
MKFTEQQKEKLGIIDGPVWQDGCDHGSEAYIASYEVVPSLDADIKKYDLYLFLQPDLGQEVCIRYGNEGGHYISPGLLINFLQTTIWGEATKQHSPEYFNALQILKEIGTFEWKPDPPSPSGCGATSPPSNQGKPSTLNYQPSTT